MPRSLEHQTVTANGVDVHVVLAGQGFPVLLLHGFPQTWYEWRKVIPTLSSRFRVIAPDLRGMGDSAKPPDGYDKRTLAKDVRELLRVLGVERAVVVGHDWGAGVAQSLVLDHPEVAERLVCIDMPYLAAEDMGFPMDAGQMLHSWYIFFFQHPDLPERVAAAAPEALLGWFFAHGGAGGRSPLKPGEMVEYLRCFSQPGAAAAGFNYYRAMLVDGAHWAEHRGRRLALPTLWIHGREDPYVPVTTTEPLPRYFENLRVEIIDGCGHWVPEEKPKKTAALLLEFLAGL
jgi:pimeloyl-ACP methyl ester carboxylesterase